MKFFHLAVAIVFWVAILASPLKGAWWYIAVKPGMEVIDRFWLPPGGHVEVLTSTDVLCLKLDEATELIPIDLVRVANIKVSQVAIEGKTVDVVTVSISKAKIEAGFAKQKYRFSLTNKKFEAKQAVEVP